MNSADASASEALVGWVAPLLTQLSIAIARRRSYADAHPMVQQADTALAAALLARVEGGEPLALTVANRELLANGVLLPSSAVVRDLASRLHMAGLGAIHFQRGITATSIGALLGTIVRRPGAPAEAESVAELPGIILGYLDYEQLGFADEETTRAEGAALWRALASRIFDGSAVNPSSAGEASPEMLAEQIARAAQDPQAADRAFQALTALADRVGLAPKSVRDLVGDRLQQLLGHVHDDALVAVLRAAGSTADRHRAVDGVLNAIPAAAVVQWLKVASTASGTPVSHQMLRLMSKMAATDWGPTEGTADQALRETAAQLLDGWQEPALAVSEHVALLDSLASWQAPSAPDHARFELGEAVELEAARLVQMACELSLVSDDAASAVQYLTKEGRIADVFDWIAQCDGGAVTQQLRELSVTSTVITQSMLATPFDAILAKRILEATGIASASAMLDALAQSESRTARRMLYDRLRTFGADLLPALLARLEPPAPWYVIRNLLSLVRDIRASLDEAGAHLSLAVLTRYVSHDHEQVRREAVRVLVLDPSTRLAALHRALADNDESVIASAVDAALLLGERGLDHPRDLALKLLSIAEDERHDRTIRERAIRAVGSTRLPDIRLWLLAHVTRRSRLFGRVSLAPDSETVRAALQVLAARYRTHPDATPVLALARAQYPERGYS